MDVKKYFSLTLLLFLTGCCHYHSGWAKFPEQPEVIHSCPDLATIEDQNITMSGLLDSVALNYNRYYVCAATVDAWQTWYNEQKANFNHH